MTDDQLSLDKILELTESTNEWEYYNSGDGNTPSYYFSNPKSGFIVKLFSTLPFFPRHKRCYSIDCILDNTTIGHYEVMYQEIPPDWHEQLENGDDRIRNLYSRAEQLHGEKHRAAEEARTQPIREKAERERIDAVKRARDLLR